MSDDSIRTLLVEDNPPDEVLVRTYLAEERDVRIELFHVERISKALELLERTSIDVVPLDLNLPDCVGLETLRQVREHWPSLPTVVLTGGEGIDQALQAVREGAADYLFKARIDGPLLVRSIRFAMERSERQRARSELEEAERRYRVLFEQSRDGIVLYGLETCLPVEFNDSACGQLGYSRQEFAQLRMRDYQVCEQVCENNDEDNNEFVSCMRKVLREGPLRCETMHRAKTGEIRYVVVHAQVITLHGEQLLHCVFRDVTEQKIAVMALAESQEQFRLLVETTADWIWATDKNGTFTYCSPRVRALLGYEPEHVVGRTLYDFVLPSEAEAFTSVVRNSMSRGTPITRLEHINLHKDGRHVVLETSAAPVLDATGALHGYRGIDRDVTEVKEARDLLREREQRYRQLLAAVTSYTYSVTVENGISVATMHGEGCLSVTGYRPEDYRRDPGLWCSMIHPDDRELVLEQVAKVFACQQAAPIEHRIFRRDGTMRWIRNTMIPHSEKGVLKRYDGLIEDITERKHAEKAVLDKELQLLTAQKIQERLLPHEAPPLPGYNLAGALYPAEFAAGDYFDYLPMGEGKTGIVIGDVSGHGFAPALIMASTHVMLRLLVETHTDVAEILTLANSGLISDTDEEHFVTLLFACLDPETRSLVYGNAGHPTGYVLDSAGNIRIQLTSTNFALGIMPDVEFFTGVPVVLEPGDTVLLLSDGILESRSPDGDFFGKERALKTVCDNLHKTAEEIVEILCQAARGFSQEKVPLDDTTAVVLKVKSESAES